MVRELFPNSILIFALASQFSPHIYGQPPVLTPGQIYKQFSPSVVLIEVPDEEGKAVFQGTGFIVSQDGRILTNYHVIQHGKTATVTLANGDAYDNVSVFEVDKRKDIALIKINAVELAPLRLGRSSSVEIGEQVFALTNPQGLQNSLSEGLVSAIRQMDGYRAIQLTAPISAGSSGGPVFNTKGEVIGIAQGSYQKGQNLNLAIPIDYARGMLTATSARPLSSIYEPKPQPKPQEELPKGPDLQPEVAPLPPADPPKPDPTSKATANAVIPKPSEELRRASIGYLTGKLFQWTLENATVELGSPTGQRPYITNGQETGKIYNFIDPTRSVYSFELAFANSNGLMISVMAYPVGVTLEQAKKTFGDDYFVGQKSPNGERLLGYKTKRVILRVDRQDRVISIGFF